MTIGHSNRSIAELIRLLAAHGVDLLVDVRSLPRSRYSPQFNLEAMPAPLACETRRGEYRMAKS